MRTLANYPLGLTATAMVGLWAQAGGLIACVTMDTNVQKAIGFRASQKIPIMIRERMAMQMIQILMERH